jgi:hypothetical protein
MEFFRLREALPTLGRVGRWGAVVAVVTAMVWPNSGCSNCRLRFEDSTVPEGQVGDPYTAIIDLNCDEVDQVTIISGQIPPGLGISARTSSVELVGIPQQAGDFTFQLEAVRYGDVDDFTGEVEGTSVAVGSFLVRIFPAGSGGGGGGNNDPDAGSDDDAGSEDAGSDDAGDPQGLRDSSDDGE